MKRAKQIVILAIGLTAVLTAAFSVEEYDWKNGWPLVGDKQIVIYGRGIR